MAVTHEMQTQIILLEVEIAEQEKQIDSLTKQKKLYEELVEWQEKLEDNLNQQIVLLEDENEHLRTIRAKLTAYSPLDNRDGQQAEGNPTRTSTGRRVGRNIAAADPKKLPYGTKLYVENYGEIEIQDTGGALRNDDKNIRIDLFHSTYNEAINFGVKDLDIRILEWGGN